jgi:hypothetical protein
MIKEGQVAQREGKNMPTTMTEEYCEPIEKPKFSEDPGLCCYCQGKTRTLETFPVKLMTAQWPPYYIRNRKIKCKICGRVMLSREEVVGVQVRRR